MLYSMTGFGRASRNFGRYTITVEIKSLNSKSLDLKMRLPLTYREKDLQIRNRINDEIERGKVDFHLDVNYPDGSHDFTINQPVFKSYFGELDSLAKEHNISPGDLLYTITRLPEVVKPTEKLVSEEEWTDVEQMINEAIQIFKTYRLHDGEPIDRDFRFRVNLISDLLNQVEPLEKGRIEKIRERMMHNLEEMVVNKMDQNRFEQEVVYYLEKYDFTEEKTRLRQHCEYFIKELESQESSKGRKLGFIVQEMGREINTLGSKANSADIQHLVVNMKDEMEKIKEQLANVL